MPVVQAFKWDGREYFYSPDHHRIFLSPEIPILSPQPPAVSPVDVHIHALYLNLSEGCNLNCEYCFNPPPDAVDSKRMSRETARGAVMKLAQWWRSNPVFASATITFFGGEPLLNRDLLEYVIHFSREWGREFSVPFSYSVSTNATLLTTNDINLFQREDVFLWVSIDGPPEIHNRRRHFRNGSGSHAIAIKNSLKALDLMGPNRVGVRATVSTGTEELSKIIGYFASLGFRIIATKPVDSNQKEHVSLQKQDLETLTNNMDECVAMLLRWMNHGLKCFPFDQDMESLNKGPVGRFVCAAGSGSLAVDIEGWLYPCHRFAGNSRYRLGHVRGEVDLEPCKEFAALDISRLTECEECWARKFCLGCCPGASVAAGNAPGYPNPQTCEERKIYALISLKCAVAEGLISSYV